MRLLNCTPLLILMQMLFILLGIVLNLTTPLLAQNEHTTPSPTIQPTPNGLEFSFMFDRSCTLPCIWGINLDETNAKQLIEVVQDYFEENNVPLSNVQAGEREDYAYVELDVISSPEEEFVSNEFSADFVFQSNQFEFAIFTLENPSEWVTSNNVFDLKNVLTSIDNKPDVYMSIHFRFARYRIALVYDNLGLMLDYEFEFTEEEFSVDKPLRFCFDPIQYLSIKVWIEGNPSISDVRERSPVIINSPEYFVPIQEMFDLTPEIFTEEFTKDRQECFTGMSYAEFLDEGYSPLPG